MRKLDKRYFHISYLNLANEVLGGVVSYNSIILTLLLVYNIGNGCIRHHLSQQHSVGVRPGTINDRDRPRDDIAFFAIAAA